jgi:hypothetical protein
MARRLKISQRRGPQAITPAAEIAMYLKRDTGIVMDPTVIRDFVAGRFVTLSVLAHEIHAQSEEAELLAKQGAARKRDDL